MFAYFEYHGTGLGGRRARMAADPKTQEWWAIHMPMQAPLDTRRQGDWWAMARRCFTTTEAGPPSP